MDFYRVGDKLISKEKLWRTVERILTMRSGGSSQQEVAQRIGIDRTFISRLEAIAEVRKGGSLAIIGFPLANKQELEKVSQEMGVDFLLFMTEDERHKFVGSRTGLELLNEMMEMMTELQNFGTVIMIGSDMRTRLAEAILGDKVIGVELGESPLTEDIEFPVERLRELIATVKGG